MKLISYILIFVALIASGNCQHFSLRNCNATQDVNGCIMQNINYMMPYLIKGIPSWGIPSASPFIFPPTYALGNRNFVFDMHRAHYFGIPACRATNVSLDQEERTFDFEILCDRLFTYFTYNMRGSFLGRYLEGEGPGVAEDSQAYTWFNISYHLEERNNQHYVELDNVTARSTTSGVIFVLTNITDSNNNTEPEINNWLSNGWPRWNDTIEIPLAQTRRSIMLDILVPLIQRFSFEELLGY